MKNLVHLRAKPPHPHSDALAWVLCSFIYRVRHLLCIALAFVPYQHAAAVV